MFTQTIQTRVFDKARTQSQGIVVVALLARTTNPGSNSNVAPRNGRRPDLGGIYEFPAIGRTSMGHGHRRAIVGSHGYCITFLRLRSVK